MRILGKFIYESVWAILVVLSLTLAGLTLGGFGGGNSWLLDLTNHFKPCYLLIQIALLLMLWVLRQSLWVWFTALFFLVNAVQVLPLYWPAPSASHAQVASIRLLQSNVCAPLKDYSRLTALVLAEKPTLVTLEECEDRCVAFLKNDGVLAKYPYRLQKSEHRLLLLSRVPFKENPLPPLHANPAVMFVRLSGIDKQPVNLFLMHSTRPSSGAPYHRNQIIQFHQIAELLKRDHNPTIMVGDFNTTPWGYSYQQLLRESGLKNTMLGFGVQPSFPVFIPKTHWTTPVIAIDHVLVSSQFVVLNRKTASPTGSDHLPVIVDLALPTH